MINEHPEHFDILKKYFNTSDYHLDIEIVKNPPLEYIKNFFEQLKQHKNYSTLKNDFAYDEESNIFIHVLNRFENSEISNLTEEQVFFYPFMNTEEIKAAFDVNSSESYLLRLRAEQVETNMRLKRTFTMLKKKHGENWSFTNYFNSNQFGRYLSILDEEKRKICRPIPHGTIHSSEANGKCLKTPFGNIVVLSYALRHFLFHMNLFHFGQQLDVPQDDLFSSFILAVRIMIGTESLDFELDPRGRLPKSIKRKIDYMTDWQMSFIIGHEYAHHYLGHLKNESALNSHSRIKGTKSEAQFYTYRQKCEFEADYNSVATPTCKAWERTELLDGGFLLFTFLDMYYQVEDYLFPKHSNSTTHPAPLDRLWTLRSSINKEIGLSNKSLKDIINHNNKFIEYFLNDFLPYNVEAIETTGSVYLKTYKKKYLIDRLDY